MQTQLRLIPNTQHNCLCRALHATIVQPETLQLLPPLQPPMFQLPRLPLQPPTAASCSTHNLSLWRCGITRPFELQIAITWRVYTHFKLYIKKKWIKQTFFYNMIISKYYTHKKLFKKISTLTVQHNANYLQLLIVSTTFATICLAGNSENILTTYLWCIALGNQNCCPHVKHIGRPSCVGFYPGCN